MALRLRFCRFAICCLVIGLPAAAQFDSYTLRAKYGAPLNRNVQMAAGFDLVVDSGPTNEVCKFQAPTLIAHDEKVPKMTEHQERMYDFLTDLVPAQIRGLNFSECCSRWARSLSRPSFTNTSRFVIREMRIILSAIPSNRQLHERRLRLIQRYALKHPVTRLTRSAEPSSDSLWWPGGPGRSRPAS